MKRAGAQVRSQCKALNRAGKVGEAARLQDIYCISHAACLSQATSPLPTTFIPPPTAQSPAVLHPGHLQSLIPHGQSSATPSARQAVGPLSLWWLVHPRDHWAPPTSPHEPPTRLPTPSPWQPQCLVPGSMSHLLFPGPPGTPRNQARGIIHSF